MATIVSVREAKAHLSRLLERVAQGEEVIIAKSGVPVVRLVPMPAKQARTSGLVKGRLGSQFFEPLSESELDAW